MTYNSERISVSSLAFGAVGIIFWSWAAFFFCFLQKLPLLQILAICYLTGGISSFFFNRELPTFKKISNHLRKNWGKTLLLAANGICYTSAFRFADPAQVDLILYTWPFLLVVANSWSTGKKLTSFQWGGLIVGFLGVVVILLPGLSQATIQLRQLWGYAIAFFAALSWVVYTLWNQRSSERDCKGLSYDFILFGIAYSCFHSFYGSWSVVGKSEALALVVLAVGTYGLGYNFWMRGAEKGCTTLIGGMSNVIPILSVGWLMAGGFVDLSLNVLIAFLLVTTGCILMGVSKKLERQTA